MQTDKSNILKIMNYEAKANFIIRPVLSSVSARRRTWGLRDHRPTPHTRTFSSEPVGAEIVLTIPPNSTTGMTLFLCN
jgi:hypothetical protein